MSRRPDLLASQNMRLLNKDWYHTLMHTPAGQITLAVCAAAIFISTAFVIKLTKPIEYRR